MIGQLLEITCEEQEGKESEVDLINKEIDKQDLNHCPVKNVYHLSTVMSHSTPTGWKFPEPGDDQYTIHCCCDDKFQ